MGIGEVTIGTLDSSFTLQSTIPPDELIHLYGAVMDSHSDMVHTGDFVEVQTPTNGLSIYYSIHII